MWSRSVLIGPLPFYAQVIGFVSWFSQKNLELPQEPREENTRIFFRGDAQQQRFSQKIVDKNRDDLIYLTSNRCLILLSAESGEP